MFKKYLILFLKLSLLLSFILFVIFISWALLFYNTSGAFDGEASPNQKIQYSKYRSVKYQDGIFHNTDSVKLDMGFKKFISIMQDYIMKGEHRKPVQLLPVKKIDASNLYLSDLEQSRITWLGHSAILLETGGQVILIDPMLSDSPAPHPWFGTKRFSDGVPFDVENLSKIDVVLISHDHYDHLDYETILKIKDKVKQFYVPLGVGAHLAKWGIPHRKIHELQWWDEASFQDLVFVCTPAQHFSGRRLFDRFQTLWCSWVIQSTCHQIYFSGDGGYNKHFKKIGNKYGPFDLAMIECGQYDKRWNQVHMMPEETVQAAQDVKADWMMPIHWGAFDLALHDWKDPIERVTKKAKTENVNIATPNIGTSFMLTQIKMHNNHWWDAFE